MFRRIRRTLLAAALTVAAGGAGAVAAGPAAAGTADDAAVAHFVVLGPRLGGLASTERSVRAAGGAVLQRWPQIGVVIATSPRADFAATVRGRPGVSAAGATRDLAELGDAARGSGARKATRQDMLADADVVPAHRVRSAARTGAVTPEPLEADQWGLRVMKSDRANAITGGSRRVLVGVLDSGIDADHPDLAANVDAARSVGCSDQGVPDPSRAAWLPTTSSHGTHVAGIAAAARNGVGVAGVAPDVRLASIKVVDDDGYIYPEYAICGFVWAAQHGVDVTSSSYFVDPWVSWCRTDPDQAAVLDAVGRAVAYARGHDVVNLAAEGNQNHDLSHPYTDASSPDNGTPRTRTIGDECSVLPTELPGVVGVTSIGAEKRKAYYSSYGVQEADVTAPGGDADQVPADTPHHNGAVLSTLPGGRYGYLSGTSMATPAAAGVVALIRSRHRGLPAPLVTTALGLQADRLPCPEGTYDPTGDGEFLATCEGGRSGRGFYGAGVVDALDAVRY